jgi:pimeloyl-ACP methyl ester carboxylesterase
MKYSLLLLSVLIAFGLTATSSTHAADGAPPAAALRGPGVEGHWRGTLRPTPAVSITVALEIANTDPKSLKAELIVVDQNQSQALTTLTVAGDVVHWEIAGRGIVYDGKLNAERSEMTGEWKQQGIAAALVFQRTAQASVLPGRPQEPERPFPYRDEEVLVKNGSAGVMLAGTLTIPQGKGPFAAVVLITGTGPQDRDESLAVHRPFLVLADHLTRHGIAVLRCDDRGFGKSTGKFSTATDADFVEDTLACVTYLRTRAEIDPARIGLLGHSEGALVGPRAAAKSPGIAFVVMLAGTGLPFEEVLIEQQRSLSLSMGVSAPLVARRLAFVRQSFEILRSPTNPADTEKSLRALYAEFTAGLSEAEKKTLMITPATTEASIKAQLTPWFRDLSAYDPQATLRALQCPVLALNGEKDQQVSAKMNLPAIRAAFDASGNHRTEVLELPGLNHLFQHSQTGALLEYGKIEETFSPEALQLISDWIASL